MRRITTTEARKAFHAGRYFEPENLAHRLFYVRDDTGALYQRASDAYSGDIITSDNRIHAFAWNSRRWTCTGSTNLHGPASEPFEIPACRAYCRRIVSLAHYDGDIPAWRNPAGQWNYTHGHNGKIVSWRGQEVVVTTDWLIIASPFEVPQQERLAGF